MEESIVDKLSQVLGALTISKDKTNDSTTRLDGLKWLYKNITIVSQLLDTPSVTDTLESIVLESENDSENNLEYFQMKRYAFSCLEKAATDLPDEFFQHYYSYLKKQLKLNVFESQHNSEIDKFDRYIDACNDLKFRSLEERFYWSKKYLGNQYDEFLGRETTYLEKERKSHVFESQVISGIDELNRRISTFSKVEKFRILKALSIHILESATGVNLSIFKQLRLEDWGKELLTYTLLTKNATWDVTQTTELVRERNRLETFLKACQMSLDCRTYCIEDVLEMLIVTEKECELDIGFVVKILTLLHSKEALDLVFEDYCFLPSVYSQLELLQLKQKCSNQKIIYTDEDQVKELQYLLVYSDKVVDTLLSKVKPETPITDLINFLERVKEQDVKRKEEFLLQLNPNESVENWKEELTLSLIESFICQEFPGWKYEEAIDIANSFDEMYFLAVDTNEREESLSYCQFSHQKKNELRESVNDGSDKPLLHKLLYDLLNVFLKLISARKVSGVTFEEVKTLITCLDSQKKIVELINALEILVEYEVDISQDNVLKILSNSTAMNVQKNIHDFIIQKIFCTTFEKSLSNLIDELVTANGEEGITFLENRQNLMNDYKKVMDAFNSKSKFPFYETAIKDFNTEQIKMWSTGVHLVETRKRDQMHGTTKFMEIVNTVKWLQPVNEEFFDYCAANITRYEKLAVIKRTMELTNKITVRDVQMLSVIILLNCEYRKGRLLQVNTGEGKTITIAMVAAYHALEKHQVDIITSSILLAIPQAKQLKEFYNRLVVNVSYISEYKNSYETDVLYGTSIDFQADILRDEFRKSGCRQSRRFDIAIVDEVDNMLVDGNNHAVMLSRKMPGMDHLGTLLASIYAQVKAAAGSIDIRDGQCFYIERENILDENGERTGEFVENHFPIEGTMRDFIKTCTESYIRDLIRDCDSTNLGKGFPEIKVPKHLRELICKTQLKNWIASAINAKFHHRIKQDYILDDTKIKIVDAHNTGVIEQSMHWSNGLHQFLEIKHGTRVTREQLVSNFMSNVTFFRRYRPNIYGLSGTLGCQKTKEFLAKTYNVDFCIVPPFKFQQHKELSPIVVNDRNNWLRTIVKSSLRKLCNGRAVLIIMEYIRETEEIEKIFVEDFRYDKKNVKLYKTNTDQWVVERTLGCGEVIVTTNIAGRGTDIKLAKDVDKNGGLHVCVTFLPKNSRVEKQNIGRTSRTGNRGTSQFVLYARETDIAELRKIRDENEEAKLRNAYRQVEGLTMQDEVFQKFCQLLDLVEGRNAYVKEIEREAVEERFAIWLRMNEDEISNGLKEKVLESFKLFREEILEDDKNGKLVKNPYMFVRIGNKYLQDKKYQSAISEYTLAIEMDPYFAEHAHYNRGYAYVAEYGGDATENSYFINKAVDDFKAARELIQEREDHLHLMQYASEGEVFSKQVCNKLNLYNIQRSAIDVAIGPDIDALNRKIQEYEARKRTETAKDVLEEISKAIEKLEGQKGHEGVIWKARSNKRDLKIEILQLKQCLPDGDESHDNEITEFEENGGIGSFQISEIKPIDWVSVIGLILLGLVQVVIGAAIIVFASAGAAFGIGLMAEGISDIITAVKDGIINHDFDWGRWAIEKGISLVITVVCAGYSTIKSTAKVLYQGAKTAASFGGKVVTQTAKEGWKLVAKKIGLTITKEIGKEMLKTLSDYGVSETIVPLIKQAIMEKVQGPIEEALKNNPVVVTMLELDRKRNNQHYQNLIINMGMELLKHGKSKDGLDLEAIGLRIANGIADKKIVGLSAARQIHAALEAVEELCTMVNSFISQLNQKLDKTASKDKLEKQLENISKTTNQEEIVEQESISQVNPEKIEGDIDLHLLHEKDEQAKQQYVQGNSFGCFVNVISTRMVNVIQHKLLKPMLHSSINYSVEYVTSNVTKSLNEQVETYGALRNVIYHQNKGYDTATTKEEMNIAEEKERIKKVEVLIDQARSDGPSGLIHLGAISDAIGRPIEVYDEKGRLKYVIGDEKRKSPAKVQYHEPERGENTGHYTLPGKREPLTKYRNDVNMCLYNVVAAQTGCNPNELKDTSLRIMENNKSRVAKQIEDINRLEMYSHLKLAMGGARYDGERPDDAEEILVNSTGAKAYNIDNLGHPLRHVPLRGTTDQKLQAISKQLGKKIEVYDKNGEILYTKGDNFEEAPIKLVYHKPEGDTSGEHFSLKDGKGPSFRFHGPNDRDAFNIIAAEAKHDPNALHSAVTNTVNKIPLDPKNVCVENYSIGYRRKEGPTGFLSQADMNYVAHHALKLNEAKEAMERLNKLDFDKKLSRKDGREVLTIPVKDLGVSRPIYAQHWVNGRPTGQIKPAKRIVMLLQHHDGKERDPDAPVHIHTIYPEC